MGDSVGVGKIEEVRSVRPTRYPYNGQKKQPRNEIAELRYELNVLKNDLSILAHQLFKN